MDANGLRALQASIKERYKTDPKAAFITLKAKGSLDEANIACKVETDARSPSRACTRPQAAPAWNFAPAICCWKRWSPVPASP